MAIPHEASLSESCYARGQYRYAEDGMTILNELGRPAKAGDIILRASNGWPLRRMGTKEPVDIDLKTGKAIRGDA
jgi:hypothetical protein